MRSVLMQKYDYPSDQADKLQDFLVPMLALDPAERPTAGQLAKHPWLDDPDAAPPYTLNYPTASVAPSANVGMGLSMTGGVVYGGDGALPGLGGSSAPVVDDERLHQVLQVLKGVELSESGQAPSTRTRTISAAA